MKHESRNQKPRKAWERPALYRMDAADAENTFNSMLDDGMNNMS